MTPTTPSPISDQAAGEPIDMALLAEQQAAFDKWWTQWRHLCPDRCGVRKEFEVTYRACFPIAAELQPNLFSFELDDDEYVEAKVHVAFTLWQAARATAEHSEPTPEPFGYVYRIISEMRPHDPMYRFAKTGELNPDPEVVRSWTKHAVYTEPQAPQNQDSVIEACAKVCEKAGVAYNVAVRKETATFLALMIRALKSQQDAAIESKPAEQPDGPSEQNCGCETCRPITMTDMRMIVCKTCGNKRCPHATDHRNACTGSNELGQPGSSYAAIESQRSGDGS